MQGMEDTNMNLIERTVTVLRNGEVYDVDKMECTDAFWNELHQSLKDKGWVEIKKFNNLELVYDEGE